MNVKQSTSPAKKMTEGPEDMMQIVREDIAALRIEMNQRLDRLESNHANGKEHPKLSLRQQAILIHLCRGETNKQIGRLLELPESTIKVHVREIMHKLVVKNRTQVAIVAASMRLI
jgi:DNA-binding NarL/FixJ family response regulator